MNASIEGKNIPEGEREGQDAESLCDNRDSMKRKISNSRPVRVDRIDTVAARISVRNRGAGM